MGTVISLIQTFKDLFGRRHATSRGAQPTPAWLVVGLGNPGAEYAETRHNVGYRVTDLLVTAPGFLPVRGIPARQCLVGIGDQEVAVLRPTTFMNVSGEGVAPLALKYGVPPERIIAIHDELDLPPGKVRLRLGGSENGHNGLKSLSSELGTRDYLRVRVGIGRPPAEMSVSDWVLSPVVNATENPATELAAEATRLLIAEGLARAQNVIHQRH